MKKTEMMNRVSGSISRMGFKLKKHSPEILVVTGVIGVVASAVMACRATMKVNRILEDSKETIDSIHDCQENSALDGAYTPEDEKKELAMVYVQTGIKFAKLYAPAVVLGTLSISGILASNNILRTRNVAMAAAYATIDKGFKEYRSRVVERFGDAVDKELKYNLTAKKIKEVEIDAETGKEKKVEKVVIVGNPNTHSEYARFYEEGCTNWEKNPEYNIMFLRSEQNYANDRLRSRGFLFLNEIYERLGIPQCREGQVVGWVYDAKNPIGDNYVDFGICEMNRERSQAGANEYERAILLDFNVDGLILDLI